MLVTCSLQSILKMLGSRPSSCYIEGSCPFPSYVALTLSWLIAARKDKRAMNISPFLTIISKSENSYSFYTTNHQI